jgi:exopolysaccharide biosynthesis polyprenyl glycosylphosphotransferase
MQLILTAPILNELENRVPSEVVISLERSRRYLYVKRLLDILGASLLLICLLPLLIVTAVFIKIDSPGPILYRQLRVGKDGRHFILFKFRSMRVGADAELAQLRHLNEASGPLFKMRRDPRVTRVGRVIRRLSIDELPQLLNVLSGDMSLVGPRPPLPREVEKYAPWHYLRLKAIPGLTGLWQVKGRSQLPFDDGVILDLVYISRCSLWFDLWILLRTIPAVLTSRGAW